MLQVFGAMTKFNQICDQMDVQMAEVKESERMLEFEAEVCMDVYTVLKKTRLYDSYTFYYCLHGRNSEGYVSIWRRDQ